MVQTKQRLEIRNFIFHCLCLRLSKIVQRLRKFHKNVAVKLMPIRKESNYIARYSRRMYVCAINVNCENLIIIRGNNFLERNRATGGVIVIT